MPSTPALPRFPWTRFNALNRFSLWHTSSINRSVPAGLSALRRAISGSGPPPVALGASPLLSSGKASLSWIVFCRLPVMSSASYLPLHTFGPSAIHPPTMPSADSWPAFESPLSSSSPFGTATQASRGKSDHLHRTPAGFTAFGPWWIWTSLPLASSSDRDRLSIRFLFVRSRLRSTLPSGHASRRTPCASLDLHLHQVGQGTLTPERSDMLGTPEGTRRRVRRLVQRPFGSATR